MAPRVSLKSENRVIRKRIGRWNSDTSQVARLVGRGEDAVLKKIGEEGHEVLLAPGEETAPRPFMGPPAYSFIC